MIGVLICFGGLAALLLVWLWTGYRRTRVHEVDGAGMASYLRALRDKEARHGRRG